MSRCRSCNQPLNDVELSRKYRSHDEYVDMCTSCCRRAGISYRDNGRSKWNTRPPEDIDLRSLDILVDDIIDLNMDDE